MVWSIPWRMKIEMKIETIDEWLIREFLSARLLNELHPWENKSGVMVPDEHSHSYLFRESFKQWEDDVISHIADIVANS